MNRHFALFTGLLICCCVPKNDVTARTMRGGDFLFNFGNWQHPAGETIRYAPNGDQAGKSNAAPEPATAGGTHIRSPRKSNTYCRPSQRQFLFYWRPSPLQAKTPDQTVAYATRANLRPAARTQRTARRQRSLEPGSNSP